MGSWLHFQILSFYLVDNQYKVYFICKYKTYFQRNLRVEGQVFEKSWSKLRLLQWSIIKIRRKWLDFIYDMQKTINLLQIHLLQ